nr:hypothetical protein BaRGS_031059 [Batillaria attramentaria]
MYSIARINYQNMSERFTLEARCVAEGMPAPVIEFSWEYGHFGGESEYVTLTQLNATTVQADLSITDPFTDVALALLHNLPRKSRV